MKSRLRIATAASIALVGAAGLSGLALAQGGLTGLFNARGTIDPFEIRDRGARLKITAHEPLDVAIVGAQLSQGAETGWHTHPTMSVVSVQPGGPALKLVTRRHGRCIEKTFEPGRSFVHPAGPHNFVNTDGTRPLNFGVAYFVPVGSTLLTPVTPPAGCP